jgi:hypothetical protein
MKIDTKLNEMDDSSNRIMKYIRYFGKEMQADKILIGLICIILVLVVLLIVGWCIPQNNGANVL